MSLRILYIEDEPEMQELVNLIIKRKGMEFHGATSGLKGLDAVKRIQPDLILLDIMMPELDGWSVYERLKADPQTEQIPVLFVTARTQSDERLREVRAANNADDYIFKPFGPSQLLETIDRVISSHRPINNA